MRQTGSLSHSALRAWARAKFNTELLVAARVRQSTMEANIKELQGVEQAEIHMALEVQDMHSGDYLTMVTSKGEAFALDRAQSVQKALTEAATDVAKKLRLWVDR
jgi:hypothetical protein